MKNILASILATLALTASAEYIRQATETYPGGGGASNAVIYVADMYSNMTAVTIGSRNTTRRIGARSFANGNYVAAEEIYAHAEGVESVAAGRYSHAEGAYCAAYEEGSHAEGGINVATGEYNHAEGVYTRAGGLGSHTEGIYAKTYGYSSKASGYASVSSNHTAYTWQGSNKGMGIWDDPEPEDYYYDHGAGTFNINPVGGLGGFYIGSTNLATHLSLAVNEAKDYTDDQISDYNITTVKPIHTSVTNLQAYLGGQNVRVSVTNYYAASSGNLPRLRIEENVSNNWMIVWDENDKFEHFKTNICEAVSDMTNATIVIVTNELAIGLATKAPLAWGDVTSSGYDAPTSNTVWMSGRTVFSGDTEFKTVQVGSGVVGFCVSKGVQAYTGGDPGQFKFTTDDGRFYFGMNIMDAYVLGCDCSNIVVTAVAGNQIVTLRYDVTMTGKPCIYYTPSLEPGFTWEKLSDSMGNPVPGASHVVSWEAAPPAGHEILYCNCGTDPKGFFKAVIEVAADNTFFTNLEADLRGGIRCTNEFLNIRNIIEPYIDDVSLTVKWRVKP